ncbi:MAG: hypothetical protein ABL901_15360 [Hyphomicrobiaceae bacterium]
MTKATKALTAIAALAVALIAVAPAQARSAIICYEDDGCRRVIILPGPALPIDLDDD